MLFKDHKKFQFKIFADEEKKSDVFIFSHVDFHFHSKKRKKNHTKRNKHQPNRKTERKKK